MHRYVKRALIAAAIVLAALIALGFVAGNVFYNLALNPEADRTAVLEAEHNQVDFGEDFEEVWLESRDWFSESGYAVLKMDAGDGTPLSAYLLENEEANGRWVVICHGYMGSGGAMSSFAQQFYERGYSLLLPDARGHGRSGGSYIGMGWHDRLDLLDWVGELNENFAPESILLYGVSMGGATVLMASGEALPDNVRAIVADCGYTSAWDEFEYQLGALFGLPSFPVMNFASIVTRLRAGYWLGEADALGQVARSTVPILFIHGSEDAFVPVEMVYELYDAAPGDRELVVAEGAGHGSSFTTLGEEYWRIIEDFAARYL